MVLLFQDSHRTVSKSFWGLKIVDIFDAKLSCYKKWEISQLLQSFFRKPCPHFASVFNLPARRPFFYTAAGGLLSAAAPSNYINTKSASSLPLHVMMFLIKGAQYNACSSFVDHLFLPWAYWGSNTIHRPRSLTQLDRRSRTWSQRNKTWEVPTERGRQGWNVEPSVTDRSAPASLCHGRPWQTVRKRSET